MAASRSRRRIRLGIWGLGRGMSFYRACRALRMDVVAGCDFNDHLRARFLRENPGAAVTADAEEFLKSDFDAVLLATYCPNHGADAIRCLEAGKHVLSEVTAFFTMAEGVRLVETVEKTGLVYNMAENYPFSKANLWLADRWKKGLFGDLMYAEFEYVHELRALAHQWLDGTVIEPGWTVHQWRSWFNFHYYNTHSLGPVMHITGERPTRVVALPAGRRLPGTLSRDPMATPGAMTPSLITMSGGGLVRNLMGMSTNDTRQQRLWGTRGSAESRDDGLFLRLGGGGESPKLKVNPSWPEHGRMADRMGHGGGDFWVLYHFARHILDRKPAFFDVYRSADCTIPGLLAYRSAMENGKAWDVPDFRKKSDRNRWRKDAYGQKPMDVKHAMFPEGTNLKVAREFNVVMKELLELTELSRAAKDWKFLDTAVADRMSSRLAMSRWRSAGPRHRAALATARRIIRTAPSSHSARVLGEILDVIQHKT